MRALGRVAEVIADPWRTRAIPAVDTKRDPLTARNRVYVHVGAARGAKEQALFFAGSKACPQQIATGRDAPAGVPAPHDQRPNPLLAHPNARPLCGLVGPDRDGPRHVVADRTPREGIPEIASYADDAHWKAPFRYHQVFDPEGRRDSKRFRDGNVRSDRHRPVTHDISNTHTGPQKTEIGTEIGKQAKRRSCGHITSIAADFLAPEMDVKL